MANATNADFLGEGTNASAKAPAARPTSPDGLFFLDTGEPTPAYYRLQQQTQATQNATRTTNVNSGRIVGSGKNFSDVVAGGGYQSGKGLVKPETNTLLDALSSLGRNPVINPIGAGLTAAGNAVNNKLGVDVTGYIQDPVGQGLRDIGAPDAIQAIANPTGYIARNTVNAGTGYGTNPLAAVQNISSAANNLRNDARNLAAAPGKVANAIGNLGSPFPTGGITPMATYTPTMGTNGGSALTPVAQSVVNRAEDFYKQNTSQSASDRQQATTYANRAAPQMALPSSANSQAVYDRAMGFQADISGAQRLENMQMDMQGINNLESWNPQYSMQGVQNLESFSPTNSQQGVNALYAFRPDATYQSASELNNYQATNTAEGANAVGGFRPEMVQRDAEALRNFRSDRTGIDRLNAYADAPEGPSAAQAMLRTQSDADKRMLLALARSGRGGPAAQVAAQRNAMAEGSLTAAETRGQASVLRAQETDAYKQRQLQALAQAGSLISQAEAQRLTGLAQAGQLMSAADQQKLQALMAYGELRSRQDQLQLSAKQSAGQLNASGDNMRLGATSNAAQLQGQMDSQLLNAKTNAAQLRSTMDAQGLSAISTAAGLRTQQDQIRSSNLQSAGNIRIAGSGQQLQALSLAGQVASDIRNQDISVLRSNLDASLQTLGLNDNQVRFFNQMASDRDQASQNLVMQANALGINATQAQSALDLQWKQFAFNQLTTQQQMQFEQQQAAQANARANRQQVIGAVGTGLSALGSLFGKNGAFGSGGAAAPAAVAPPVSLPQVPNFQLTPTNWNNVGGTAGAYTPGGMPAGLGGYNPIAPIYQLTQPSSGATYENQI